jgi:hypothetical protein
MGALVSWMDAHQDKIRVEVGGRKVSQSRKDGNPDGRQYTSDGELSRKEEVYTRRDDDRSGAP